MVDLWTGLLGGTLVYRSVVYLRYRGYYRCERCGSCGSSSCCGSARKGKRAAAALETDLAVRPAEDRGGSTAAAAAEDQTLPGRIVELGIRASVRSSEGSIEDADMDAFLVACKTFLEVMQVFGTATNLAAGDIAGNMASVRNVLDEDPEQRRTFLSFLQAELDSNQHIVGQGNVCQLMDPSGACKLQWLLRGLEFSLTLMKLLMEGDTQAAPHAYEQTLKQYHGWATSLVVRTALLAVPSKESLCSIQALGPRLRDGDELARAVSRDILLAVDVMLPLVQFMVQAMREHGLWESRTV